MASVDLVPVAGNPLAIGRRLAPDAADPDEVVSRDVPAPVAGYPLDILAGRLLVGGDSLIGDGGSFSIVGAALGSWTTGAANAS